LLSWCIPFLAALPFYNKNGTLLIDLSLFKSIMIVIASITAAVLLVWFFRSVTAAFTREAVITGFVWLILNWTLDAIVFAGLLRMPGFDYVTRIGLRSLLIPAMVIAAGIIADEAVLRHSPLVIPAVESSLMPKTVPAAIERFLC